MYEKGDKKRKAEGKGGWDNQALYLPTLIVSNKKFVFMFNYSDDPEELKEAIEQMKNWGIG